MSNQSAAPPIDSFKPASKKSGKRQNKQNLEKIYSRKDPMIELVMTKKGDFFAKHFFNNPMLKQNSPDYI